MDGKILCSNGVFNNVAQLFVTNGVFNNVARLFVASAENEVTNVPAIVYFMMQC